MRGFLLLLRAEFGRALRRRAVAGIGVLALVLVVVASANNYSLVPESEATIELLRRLPPLPQAPPIIGLPGGRAETRVIVTEVNPREVERRRLQLLRKYLGPEHSHLLVLGLLGTGWGITLAVLLAATLFGAEFRWGYWKTLVLHQPSRWRVVVAKFVVLFCLLLVGLVFLLAISYPVNWTFARIYDVDTVGRLAPPSALLRELMRSWLSTSAFAALAAATTMISGLGLVGAGGVMLFAFADGSFASSNLRLAKVFKLSFASLVADLFHYYPHVSLLRSYSWVVTPDWSPPIEELAPPGHLTASGLAPDQFFAVVVLLALALLAVLVTWAVVKRRDVPA